MTEVEEVAQNIAEAFKKHKKYPSALALHNFIYEQLEHESYNYMDQVEAAAKHILWPHVYDKLGQYIGTL